MVDQRDVIEWLLARNNQKGGQPPQAKILERLHKEHVGRLLNQQQLRRNATLKGLAASTALLAAAAAAASGVGVYGLKKRKKQRGSGRKRGRVSQRLPKDARFLEPFFTI